MLQKPTLSIKVVTVDDHKLVQEGIATFLSTQKDIALIGQASSASEAIEVAVNLKPDVILMDLQLNGTAGGIEAIEAIKKQANEIEIIVLTSYHQDDYIFPAFEAGALSYLLKDISPEELIDAIHKASQKEPVLSSVVAKRFLKQMSDKKSNNILGTLSNREFEILKLVALGKSNAEIAEQLFIAIKTVRSHVSSLLGKLYLRDRTQAAILAWKQGLMGGFYGTD